jgi:iron complex outermembrane receptor protein
MLGFTLFDLERIEIRPGPQGVLYGRNTTGGAIDVIPAVPERSFQARARLRVGNLARREIDAILGGALNDELTARLAGYALTRAGDETVLAMTDQGYRATSNGRLERRAARLSLAWTPTETFSALLVGSADFDDSAVPAYRSLGYTDANGSCASALVLDVGTAPACPALATDPAGSTRAFADGSGDARTRFGAFHYGQRDSSHLYAVALKTETLLNRTSLTSRTGVRYMNRFVGASAGSPYIDGDVDRNVEIASFSHDTRLRSAAGGDTPSWVLGFSFTHDRNDDLESVDFAESATFAPAVSAPLVYTRQFNQSTDVSSLYFARNIALSRGWMVSAGIRDSHEHRVFNYAGRTSVAAPGGLDSTIWPNANDSHSMNGVPAHLGLSRRQGDTIIRLGVAYAYRAGSVPGSIMPSPADPAAGGIVPQAGQEKLRTVEASLETPLGAPGGQLEARLFRTDVKELQAPDLARATAIQRALGDVPLGNLGSARASGVEVRLTQPMGAAWRVETAAVWQSASITTGPYAGTTPAESPRLSATLRMHWEPGVHLFALQPFGSLDARYRSAMVFTLPNAATDRQGAYGLLGGSVGLRTDDGRVAVSAWTRNLANRSFRLAAFAAGSSLLPDRALEGQGRAFGLAASYALARR